MWLYVALSACLVATAAWAGMLSDILSDPGTATGDETDISLEHNNLRDQLLLEHANLRDHLLQEHAHFREHQTHHKCKEHDANKKRPHEKAALMAKTIGYAAGPMPSGAGAVRDNFEDLSTMSSLSPNFWVRKVLPIRATDPKWNKNADCFYDYRNTTRHYPSVPGHSCYTDKFAKRQTAWWNFWPEIRGDLQYAFDFVMWDEYEQYHETNQFWYLMLYLKSLVTRVKSPDDIAPRDPSAWRPHPNNPPSANNATNKTSHNKEAVAPVTGKIVKPYASAGVHFGDFNLFGELLDDTNQTAGGLPLHDSDIVALLELLKEYKEKLDHLEFLLTDLSSKPAQVEVVTVKRF